jgi:hypothetical protein
MTDMFEKRMWRRSNAGWCATRHSAHHNLLGSAANPFAAYPNYPSIQCPTREQNHHENRENKLEYQPRGQGQTVRARGGAVRRNR